MPHQWQKAALDQNEAAEVLAQYADLVEHFLAMKNGSMVAFYTRLAEKLSAAIGRPQPWGWRYIQGVHAGKIKPSHDFARAVSILAAAADGLPAEIARLVKVDIWAEPGAVQHGAIVMGESRVCATPGCNRVFVPNTPRRKYCPLCRPRRRE